MNIALLTAGGSGTRMGMEIPKQFLTIEDKPIIVYTLERFQNHPAIDGIIIACKEGWENILNSYVKQYNITKVVSIIRGGENGQESIKNMIFEAKRLYNDDDIVLVHDGNRPMISQDIISNGISTCKQKGNAIATVPCNEVMLLKNEKQNSISEEEIAREKLVRTQTPHVFILKDLYDMHKKAIDNNIVNTAASCSLAIKLGVKINFIEGSEKNLKITLKDDLDIFKALLAVEKSKKN